MQNYWNYFTEIEEHFQRRRGALLLLSTLDWALVETWREAGVPLASVLEGINSAFDKYEARKNKGRQRRVNGLAYCAQAVVAAAEEHREAAVGAQPAAEQEGIEREGFERGRIAEHLQACALQLRSAALSERYSTIIGALESLTGEVRNQPADLEDLEQKLTVLEQKLYALVVSETADSELLTLRQQAAAELAPYRSRMQAMQIRQVEQQFLHKRLLERCDLPRLSLFYMSHS